MDPPAKTPAPGEKQENVTALDEGMEQPADQDTTPAPVDVEVRYLGSGTFSIAGGVTGRTYVFHGHGALLTMDAADADGLLQLERRRQRCCGRGEQVTRPFAPA